VVGADPRRRRGGGSVRRGLAAPIVESDISAVAARALLTDDLSASGFRCTGPQAVTNTELVRVIGDVLRRPFSGSGYRPGQPWC
jgi:uncharacterized protein YbjT (DUF2867 family)